MMLATGVYSYLPICHLFSSLILIIFNPHQPIHEAQIYFVFLSVGQNGFAKVRCKVGSSFASIWFTHSLINFYGVREGCAVERWLVRACKCAYASALAFHRFNSVLSVFITVNALWISEVTSCLFTS